MKIWPIILIFLIIGAVVIVRTHQIDLKSGEGRTEFIFKFTRWLYTLGGNMQEIAGYAIKMDWMPQKEGQINSTKNP